MLRQIGDEIKSIRESMNLDEQTPVHVEGSHENGILYLVESGITEHDKGDVDNVEFLHDGTKIKKKVEYATEEYYDFNDVNSDNKTLVAVHDFRAKD